MNRLSIALSLAALTLTLPARAEHLRVMFIGNSFTQERPPETASLINSTTDITGVSATCEEFTIGGVGLDVHWQDNQRAKDSLATGTYNFVFLQGHHTEWEFQGPRDTWQEGADNMMKYYQLWADLARENGTEPVLYMTWTSTIDNVTEDRYNVLRTFFEDVQDSLQCLMAPTGVGHWAVHQERHDFFHNEMYYDNLGHTGDNANYLNDCVFFALLTGHSPVGIVPYEVQFSGGTRSVTPENGDFLQEKAWEAYQAYYAPIRSIRNGGKPTSVIGKSSARARRATVDLAGHLIYNDTHTSRFIRKVTVK